MSATATPQRIRLRVRGVVQGVGFRPGVHRLAARHGVGGFVLNDGDGVAIEAEAEPSALAAFVAALERDAPPLARISSITREALAPRGERTFAVRASISAGVGTAGVPPDVATCDDCLRELFDPGDRRFRHPFVNCTACGPRLTIVTGVPYDRTRTTMAGFALCADCRREYEDPADRRFHAEAIACPACGPRLDAPLADAVGLLRDGAILAVKGLGGWHLACRADDEGAVARLRARKHRERKPLAVMTPRPETLALIGLDEAALLRSPARPIVLVAKRTGAGLAPSVAPGSPLVGLMLPYTPLHHLLCADAGLPLVMTSGNLSDEPIATGDQEARTRLGAIADGFLGHDRRIHRRCEDSVVRAGLPLRRARGLAPGGLPLPRPARVALVAAGAELKSTFCVARGDEAFLSPHLGDLEGELAYRAFRSDLALYLDMLGVEPEAIACDLHPEYLSTKWAHDQGLPIVEVQHHHAHAAACLADHGETGPALAIVLDGTGYGPDGTLWGGEVLRCDLVGYERVAHLEAVPMPGGEAAIREPWRAAAAHLERAGRPVPWERWSVVRESMRAHAPLSAGAGRLFDAAAALLLADAGSGERFGPGRRVSYEGQAAVELEHLAGATAAAPYRCSRSEGVIAGAELVGAVVDDLAAGRPAPEVAAAFHEGVAAAFAKACLEAGGAGVVALSGGCFQNRRLLDGVALRLRAGGLRVLTHRRVPPNDGGVSYGQAVVAAARLA